MTKNLGAGSRAGKAGRRSGRRRGGCGQKRLVFNRLGLLWDYEFALLPPGPPAMAARAAGYARRGGLASLASGRTGRRAHLHRIEVQRQTLLLKCLADPGAGAVVQDLSNEHLPF